MTRIQLYYLLKPLIPGPLRFLLRRRMVEKQRRMYAKVWPVDERARTRPFEWTGWPDGKRFALVLTHDVETEEGHEHCEDLVAIEEALGFRSAFNFVPERYAVSPGLRRFLQERDFEVGVHGLHHDGKLFKSKRIFDERAIRINHYLRKWGAVGFRAPSMHHRLDWIHGLDIAYDASTFDTDPFEPQPDGIGTIFPLWVESHQGDGGGYVELPYTVPQDSTLFVFMGEPNIATWCRKLDWLAEQRGMALMITHPDYMSFGAGPVPHDKYPSEFYAQFLRYVKRKYEGQYWHALPRDVAHFVADKRSAGDLIRDVESRMAAGSLPTSQ